MKKLDRELKNCALIPAVAADVAGTTHATLMLEIRCCHAHRQLHRMNAGK